MGNSRLRDTFTGQCVFEFLSRSVEKRVLQQQAE